MASTTQSEKDSGLMGSDSSLVPGFPDGARILIVCDHDPIAGRLTAAFREAGLTPERANTMTEGCNAARSGRFQVIFTTAILRDGSWKRLVDVANHYDLHFAIVLVGDNVGFGERAAALENGAFDVLDELSELPSSGDATRRALWAAYLNGGGPFPKKCTHPMAA